MSDYVLSQLLVGVVLCFDLASFQFREKRYVLGCLVFSAMLMGVHFYLVEAYTGAVLGFIAAVRFFLAIFTSARWLLYVFLCLVLINAVLSFAGWITVLATTGSLISTTAAFSGKDKVFREGMMLATLFWIAHNVLAGSPGAVVLETFFLGSNMFAYYRFYWRSR
jgi:hypothetical protein